MYVSFVYSDATHTMSTEAAEAGAHQRLPVDGGRIHQEPGASEATGGETGGLLSKASHLWQNHDTFTIFSGYTE